MGRRLLVLVNRAAGTTDDDSVEAAVAALGRGAEVTVAATADLAELRTAVSGLGDRRPVVIGGDGSVHAAVQALDRAGVLHPSVPVGVIPRGTGNDLAGTLGLPPDPVEAVAAVLDGTPRPLDLVRDDAGGLVVNAVHVGVGALAAAEALRFKERLGTVAFPLAPRSPAQRPPAGPSGWRWTDGSRSTPARAGRPTGATTSSCSPSAPDGRSAVVRPWHPTPSSTTGWPRW